MQLLMVNEDRSEAEWLAARLHPAGFVVQWHASVSLALDAGSADSAAAILVIDGTGRSELASSVRSIRSAGVEIPVLLVATSDDWRAKVDCLDEGADDVILKPVRSEEISARLRAIVRRSAGQPTDRIQLGPVDLDLKARCAWLRGACLDLTRGEFRLLRLLMLNPDRTVSHEAILEQLARHGVRPSLNAVEVQVARLRRKLDEGQIRTIRGIGYRFSTDLPAMPAPRSPCLAGCKYELGIDQGAAQETDLDTSALMI